jgi:hypothetical protein
MEKEWKEGNRSFYWDDKKYIDKEQKIKNIHPLCLQSKEYNRDMKGVTWVYYSKKDAKKLLNFLKSVFE